MNKLFLKEQTGNYVLYTYIADGKGTEGEIKYYFGTRDFEIIKLASNDIIGYFAEKAYEQIMEFDEASDFRKECVQAWG